MAKLHLSCKHIDFYWKRYCLCCKWLPLFGKQKGEILNNLIATVFYAVTMNGDRIFQSLGLLKLTKTRKREQTFLLL